MSTVVMLKRWKDSEGLSQVPASRSYIPVLLTTAISGLDPSLPQQETIMRAEGSKGKACSAPSPTWSYFDAFPLIYYYAKKTHKQNLLSQQVSVDRTHTSEHVKHILIT